VYFCIYNIIAYNIYNLFELIEFYKFLCFKRLCFEITGCSAKSCDHNTCCRHSFCKDHIHRLVFVVVDDNIWEDMEVVAARNSMEHKDPINYVIEEFNQRTK